MISLNNNSEDGVGDTRIHSYREQYGLNESSYIVHEILPSSIKTTINLSVFHDFPGIEITFYLFDSGKVVMDSIGFAITGLLSGV